MLLRSLSLLTVALLVVSPALAQENNRAQQRAGQAGTSSVPGLGQMDDATSGDSIRVSQLIGANIYDPRGEDIGDIDDIVIDASGKVRYAAVSYGGFLGIGDKLFAVPFRAFKTKRDDDGDFYLTLNVTKEQLEGAQGFDEDNWPNLADENFNARLNKIYRLEAETQSETRSRTQP